MHPALKRPISDISNSELEELYHLVDKERDVRRQTDEKEKLLKSADVPLFIMRRVSHALSCWSTDVLRDFCEYDGAETTFQFCVVIDKLMVQLMHSTILCGKKNKSKKKYGCGLRFVDCSDPRNRFVFWAIEDEDLMGYTHGSGYPLPNAAYSNPDWALPIANNRVASVAKAQAHAQSLLASPAEAVMLAIARIFEKQTESFLDCHDWGNMEERLVSAAGNADSLLGVCLYEHDLIDE